MSDAEKKPRSGRGALPTMRTPSGRFVYDPSQIPANAVDPGELRDLFEEARAIANADAREAVPEPGVVESTNGGVIVVAGEEAVRAHAAAVIEPRAAPHVPSAPVRIAEAVDPRRQPTKKITREAGKGPAIDREALPSATAPSSGPPASGVAVVAKAGSRGNEKKRVVWWAGGVVAACAIAIVAIVVGRGGGAGAPEKVAAGTGTGATSGSSVPIVASGSRSGDTGTGIEAMAPPANSATGSEPATSATGAASTAPEATSTTSEVPAPRVPASSAPSTTRSAPPARNEPSGDAGTAPSKPAPSPGSAPSTSPSAPAPKPGPTLWFGEQ